MRKVVSVTFAVVAAAGLNAVPALADSPGVGAATVVSVGDSAISGEAGRWAGNTNGSPSNVDALGSTAYFDNAGATGEAIHGCHRSKASEIGIGGGVAAATGMANLKVFEAQNALVGHRLCENTDGLLEEQGLASWHSAGAADRSEWVSQIRTTTTLFGPYQLQEDAHPSYWGELALRNCVRQAYNAGAPRGGTCSHTATGLNALGEPNMSLG